MSKAIGEGINWRTGLFLIGFIMAVGSMGFNGLLFTGCTIMTIGLATPELSKKL